MNETEYPFYMISFISSGPSNLKAGGNKYRCIQMTFPVQLFLYFATFCKQDHCILLTRRFNIFEEKQFALLRRKCTLGRLPLLL